MIREFRLGDLEEIMSIWLDVNILAHTFIDSSYWKSNYEGVKEIIPQSTIYVIEENERIKAFVGLIDDYIAGIFVLREVQSKGIGKALLDYCKGIHSHLSLHVYQKNERAVHFYLRENFTILDERMDEDTGEMEYVMEWNKVS